MKRGTTVYLYELAWILPSFAIPVGMLVALVVTAFGAGVHLPGNEGRVDSRTAGETGPFADPGLVQIAPGLYEVRMTAQIWSFAPGEIRVPVGSTVHFWATSKDVVHGFLIPKHIVNVMLLPGQVAHAQVRFDEPGEFHHLPRVLRDRASHDGGKGDRGAAPMSSPTGSEQRLTAAFLIVAHVALFGSPTITASRCMAS
jgi:cytochrome c oxidase subunit 2